MIPRLATELSSVRSDPPNLGSATRAKTAPMQVNCRVAEKAVRRPASASAAKRAWDRQGEEEEEEEEGERGHEVGRVVTTSAVVASAAARRSQ